MLCVCLLSIYAMRLSLIWYAQYLSGMTHLRFPFVQDLQAAGSREAQPYTQYKLRTSEQTEAVAIITY